MNTDHAQTQAMDDSRREMWKMTSRKASACTTISTASMSPRSNESSSQESIISENDQNTTRNSVVKQHSRFLSQHSSSSCSSCGEAASDRSRGTSMSEENADADWSESDSDDDGYDELMAEMPIALYRTTGAAVQSRGSAGMPLPHQPSMYPQCTTAANAMVSAADTNRLPSSTLSSSRSNSFVMEVSEGVSEESDDFSASDGNDEDDQLMASMPIIVGTPAMGQLKGQGFRHQELIHQDLQQKQRHEQQILQHEPYPQRCALVAPIYHASSGRSLAGGSPFRDPTGASEVADSRNMDDDCTDFISTMPITRIKQLNAEDEASQSNAQPAMTLMPLGVALPLQQKPIILAARRLSGSAGSIENASSSRSSCTDYTGSGDDDSESTNFEDKYGALMLSMPINVHQRGATAAAAADVRQQTHVFSSHHEQASSTLPVEISQQIHQKQLQGDPTLDANTTQPDECRVEVEIGSCPWPNGGSDSHTNGSDSSGSDYSGSDDDDDDESDYDDDEYGDLLASMPINTEQGRATEAPQPVMPVPSSRDNETPLQQAGSQQDVACPRATPISLGQHLSATVGAACQRSSTGTGNESRSSIGSSSQGTSGTDDFSGTDDESDFDEDEYGALMASMPINGQGNPSNTTRQPTPSMNSDAVENKERDLPSASCQKPMPNTEASVPKSRIKTTASGLVYSEEELEAAKKATRRNSGKSLFSDKDVGSGQIQGSGALSEANANSFRSRMEESTCSGTSKGSSVSSESEWSTDGDSEDSSSAYDELMAEMPIAIGRSAPATARKTTPFKPAPLPPRPVLPSKAVTAPVELPLIPEMTNPMEGLAFFQNIRKDLEKVGRMITAKKDGEKFLQRAHILASINWLAANVPACVLDHLGQEIRRSINKKDKAEVNTIDIANDDASEVSDLGDNDYIFQRKKQQALTATPPRTKMRRRFSFLPGEEVQDKLGGDQLPYVSNFQGTLMFGELSVDSFDQL